MSSDGQPIAVTKLLRERTLEGTDLLCQYHTAVNMPGVAALWVGRHRPTDDDPHHYETFEQAWFFGDREFATVEEAVAAWQAHEREKVIRDRVGESLRRFRFGLIRPLWRDMQDADREGWMNAGDVLMRLFASFALRIDMENDDGHRGP